MASKTGFVSAIDPLIDARISPLAVCCSSASRSSRVSWSIQSWRADSPSLRGIFPTERRFGAARLWRRDLAALGRTRSRGFIAAPMKRPEIYPIAAWFWGVGNCWRPKIRAGSRPQECHLRSFRRVADRTKRLKTMAWELSKRRFNLVSAIAA